MEIMCTGNGTAGSNPALSASKLTNACKLEPMSELEMTARQARMLDELGELAEARGGECLSDRYINGLTVLRWRCEMGHVWETLAEYIRRGAWCPRCADARRGNSIEHMQELAEKHGGECLSPEYAGSLTKLLWRCAQGHEFLATPNTIKGGSWCRYCRLRMGSLEQAQQHAKQKRGKCLSTEYKHKDAKLLWRCHKGHEWKATWGHVKLGSWCPHCAGHVVTLDDMRRIAKTHGGECLSTRYVNTNTVMKFRCKKGHEFETKAVNVGQGHWCPKCGGTQRRTLADMREAARARGGRCVSNRYYNLRTKLTWECARGHRWDALPGHVIKGSWCPQCAPSRMHTLADMQNLARERGGLCLSTRYVKSRSKLRWRCNKGHEFELTPSDALKGKWCRQCRRT